MIIFQLEAHLIIPTGVALTTPQKGANKRIAKIPKLLSETLNTSPSLFSFVLAPLGMLHFQYSQHDCLTHSH